MQYSQWENDVKTFRPSFPQIIFKGFGGMGIKHTLYSRKCVSKKKTSTIKVLLLRLE